MRSSLRKRRSRSSVVLASGWSTSRPRSPSPGKCLQGGPRSVADTPQADVSPAGEVPGVLLALARASHAEEVLARLL